MRGMLLRFLGLLWLVRANKLEPNRGKKLSQLKNFCSITRIVPLCILPNVISLLYGGFILFFYLTYFLQSYIVTNNSVYFFFADE
jgi:hypothetical protein